MIRRPPRSTRTDTLFPYTTLFRSAGRVAEVQGHGLAIDGNALAIDRDLEILPVDTRGPVRGRVERLTKLAVDIRSEEHTSELQSLMRISYAVFCLKKKKKKVEHNDNAIQTST